ncbi:MAG: DUF47 family protein [Hyphomicrobiaceae bacterium]|nr:DUF47 family protein [Hyphomicrobiaceae bacterium]
MAGIADTFGRFFGPSNNDRYAELMVKLADRAIECIRVFRKSNGTDLDGIIALERQGDRICDEIHEILDNSFILRFDIPDAMKLTEELDNVLDGIRKTAMHIDIYRPLLKTTRDDALELGKVSEEMITRLRNLVAMLQQSRLDLPAVRVLVTEIDDYESEADRIVAGAERRLVAEYSPQGANRLEFIAWNSLYQHLENMTDHANHCAKLVLSLARKEA